MLITDRERLKDFDASHRVWQGIPGIEQTKKGRTFVCFYSGETAEVFGNYEVLIQSDDLHSFSAPVAAAYVGPSGRCFDGALWIDPTGRLWFIWNLQPDNLVCAAICEDPDADELKWSEPFRIGEGVMLNKPTVLSSGEWLFPIALWKNDVYFNMRNRTDGEPAAYVYKTSDNGATFTRLGGSDLRERVFDEHMLLEINKDILKMYVRTKYGIGVSSSYDRGLTWTTGEDSGFGGPGSRFHIRKLSSGRVLLINHLNFTGRNNLTALLSEDGGKTFPYSLLLDERSRVSYPDAVEGEDGFLYVVYDRDRGCFKKSLEEAYVCAREILIAKITENDILNGALCTPGSELKITASRLGRLPEGAADPYEKTVSGEELADQWLRYDKEKVLDELFRAFPFDCVKQIEYSNVRKFDKLLKTFLDQKENDPELMKKMILCLQSISAKPSDPSPVVDRLLDYVDAHLYDNFTLDELSEKFSVSKYYMSHVFSQATGISIIKYRNERRITQAKTLLIQSGRPISEIALSLGFDSSSNFSKIFAEHEKITPTRYRRLHKPSDR